MALYLLRYARKEIIPLLLYAVSIILALALPHIAHSTTLALLNMACASLIYD